ncbi:hypothetical protein [Flavobacterium sp. 7A]|uniref:hypothetical protein n=1 Tax=Flavobacterium sp. 7A TaxID=2940571 RepID=UPI00222759EF|nr:hypothetical protein [Flavobacterium sp. 7A]MCW2121175.1 hypothetical protein [Flavobacterium sp. 7A]
MKENKIMKIFIGLILSIGLMSCSKNDDQVSRIQPSTNLITMEAEGGETEISFINGDWSISEVINENENLNIHGNIYSKNGALIQENQTLSLEAQGKMVTIWNDKGFVITRETSSSLKIELIENSTDEEFEFTLVLKSGEEIKKIVVYQKKSHGYQFDSIKYILKKEDGDSLFVKKGTNFEFNIQQSQSFTFSPYEGIKINNNSQFVSSDKNAFVWLKNASILVEIPTSFYNQEIYFNGEKKVYSNVESISSHVFQGMETVVIPVGQSAFSSEIEYRKRKVSYELRLINNRTAEEKIIEGKWIEFSPTGNYSIKWQD